MLHGVSWQMERHDMGGFTIHHSVHLSKKLRSSNQLLVSKTFYINYFKVAGIKVII